MGAMRGGETPPTCLTQKLAPPLVVAAMPTAKKTMGTGSPSAPVAVLMAASVPEESLVAVLMAASVPDQSLVDVVEVQA